MMLQPLQASGPLPVDDCVVEIPEVLLQADHQLPHILQQAVVPAQLKVSCWRAVLGAILCEQTYACKHIYDLDLAVLDVSTLARLI